jgi:ribonuclease T1
VLGGKCKIIFNLVINVSRTNWRCAKCATNTHSAYQKHASFAGIMRGFFMYWRSGGCLLLLLMSWACQNQPNHERTVQLKPATQAPNTAEQSGKTASAIPAHVLEVLTYVQQHDEAPTGYVGGRTFQNREKNLPQKSPNGQRIKYREWDVHPKIRGQNRGAERLVTGSDGSAWYTANHYQSFKKIE